MADRRILFVHAHPDDESINNGATMAKYVAEGAQVTLVTCTRGEEGEIITPELAHLAADQEDGLGAHREKELAAAMSALGVTDYQYLGGAGRYRDSGMIGTPPNERPDCFWRADLREASDHLVAVIRDRRPQVLVTYDEYGNYGHPDHIQAHRVATYAQALAGVVSYKPELGEAWDIPKLYWTATSEKIAREGVESLRAAGKEIPFDVTEEMPELLTPDELIAAKIDAEDHADAKRAAMLAHATQISVEWPYYALSNNLGKRAFGLEVYRLARGTRGPLHPSTGAEADLFAGVA
ncbi:N-acetyl-1-D-myo-inositol-2-amino-2-deoxy-alpha-D-glucopyranoside deacetylase [Tenggerimyces flavus]|uniref:1D-myo-inositol 2-acetamido-2-deoxy-alpha-D-glucopyranoside deacetylase n=1 Tax=Tenggerimyces flavus TaxID=1708749 RepID=A0ABV7YK89_9ACTN|nr:N-acetyl-1-D-myo-inositol-2-amino-2-deoxy-alpha-D-glucopyranoside deacetylase [Tenggerimyces flavus]MBM7790950.1 N-acetyl-1-D-myo-inositol-2-amino-2-deoxy-alpha-D-glucopyranoside deacetylase [Tenggerimyces flavus]